jgi:N-formylglutamate deformylase
MSAPVSPFLAPPLQTQIYTLTRNITAESCPLILDSPHSGAFIPADFRMICSADDLRSSTDMFIDQLIASAPLHGATSLTAEFHRSYIDLNRALDDLDPKLCSSLPDWPLKPSRRTAYGLGLIHTKARGQAIYDTLLDKDTIIHRVNHYYRPYYRVLDQELARLRQNFGSVLHLNMHAMPSHSHDGKPLPDIVIGDRDGTTAQRFWRDCIADLFKQAGFVVTINTPYKGVEIIRHTGKPRQNQHALQIEINKALYMNEQTLEQHEGWNECRQSFDAIWQALTNLLRETSSQRHAAE